MSILKQIAEGTALLEVSKALMGRYVKKAADQMQDAGAEEIRADHADDGDGASDMAALAGRRKKGIAKAVDRLTKEEVEQVDEISKQTAGNYIKAAGDKLVDHAYDMGTASKDPGGYEDFKKARGKASKRLRGIGMATAKLTKEEAVEEARRLVDEAHAKKRGRPKKARHEDGEIVNDPDANL